MEAKAAEGRERTQTKSGRFTPTRVMVALGIYLLIYAAYESWVVWFTGSWETASQYGDLFGGFNALVSGLGLLAIAATLKMQSAQTEMQATELELQRAELELTRRELKGQKEALEAQTEALRAQNNQLRRTSEAALMQQLMGEYDDLRESIQRVTEWMEREGAPAAGLMRAAVNHIGHIDDQTFNRYRPALDANEHRHLVSRFFVKIRKLSDAGYINNDLVVISLDRRAAQMFLTYIDPLDEAVAGVHYRDRDREYFKYLLERVYPPEIRIPTSNLGIAGHAPTSIIGTPSKGEFAAPTS